MIRDLLKAGQHVTTVVDIGIVGAGIAGLVLATRLGQAGLRVAVMETGDEGESTAAQALNEIEFTDGCYLGATKGRARRLGGTSVIWGGALLPFFPEDLSARPEIDAAPWPVSFAELDPYLKEVDHLFSLAPGSYETLEVGRLAGRPPATNVFVPRYAKWPSFRRRNLATLFRNVLRETPHIEIWLNATVVCGNADRQRGLLKKLIARSPSGHLLEVSAQYFILCAGAIEATRLLLWLDGGGGASGMVAGRTALGKYFFDHLSAPLATIVTDNPYWLNRMAGFIFERSTMRSLRYEITPAARRRFNTGAGFCHIAFKPLQHGGIDRLRQFMRTVQRGRPNLFELAACSTDVGYFLRALYWRIVYCQLYWPRPVQLDLHVVGEQLPDANNAISLSHSRDHYDVPLVSLAWRIRERDIATMRCLAIEFDRFWRLTGLAAKGALRWHRTPGLIDASALTNAADIFHPGGTTRMGKCPSVAVVNENLAVYGLPNVYVASTSTFPAGAGANPTLMLILLTMRLADRLKSLSTKGM
jgi:choline dehydrogenase-like flavoprotein